MNLYERAAELFVAEEVPHICYAVARADGYATHDYLKSAAVRAFQELFAGPGGDYLSSEDMLDAVGADGFRDFSVLLALTMAAVNS